MKSFVTSLVEYRRVRENDPTNSHPWLNPWFLVFSMGDAVQISRADLQDMIQEATKEALKAAARANIKKKLAEHIAGIEKQHVSDADEMEAACVRVPLPAGLFLLPPRKFSGRRIWRKPPLQFNR